MEATSLGPRPPGRLRALGPDHNSLLVVTFDEDDGRRQNHMTPTVVGPIVRPGDVSGPTDRCTLLRTLEDTYGLPALGELSR